MKNKGLIIQALLCAFLIACFYASSVYGNKSAKTVGAFGNVEVVSNISLEELAHSIEDGFLS